MRRVVLLIFLAFGILAGAADGATVCAGLATPIPLPAPAAKGLAQPSTGTRHALAIFAGFEGSSPATGRAPEWSTGLFALDRPGSFTHFYDTMSFGRLVLTGEVAGHWYEAEGASRDYLATDHAAPGDYGRFSAQILRRADADIDFTRFDNDGPDGIPGSTDDDGRVDAVFLVLAHVPRNFLVGSATGIANLGLTEDYVTHDIGPKGPVVIPSDHGVVLQGRSYPETVGTMAHEFGHLLGLPDLFDTAFTQSDTPLPPSRDSAGIGAWGLMGWGALGWQGGDGPVSFSAWSRIKLGWARVHSPGSVLDEIELTDVGQRGDILEIPVTASERFVVEYRRRTSTGYDRNMPGEGLLIWHYGAEGDPPVFSLDLETADGRWRDAGPPIGRVPAPHDGEDNLDFWAHDAAYARDHGGNLGDAGDPFGHGMAFTPTTNPSSLSADGTRSVAIQDIQFDGDIARFQVTLEPGRLRAASPQLVGNNDGVATPGEELRVAMQIGNVGGLPLTDVTLSITTDDPLLTVERAASSVGILGVGQWARLADLELPTLRVGDFEESTDVRIRVRASATNVASVDTVLVVPAVSSVRVSAVVLGPSGEPLAGIPYSLAASRFYYSGVTDEEGRLEDDVVPGVYTLLVGPGGGYAAAFRLVQANMDVEMEIALAPFVRLTGTVTDADGSPLPRVAVRTGFDKSALTDDQGRFEIRSTAGAQTVYLTPMPADEASGIPQALRALQIDGDTDVHFVLGRGVHVTMDIGDPNGVPINTAFSFYGGNASVFGSSTREGTFTVETGSYVWSVSPDRDFGGAGGLIEVHQDTTIQVVLPRWTQVTARFVDRSSVPSLLQSVIVGDGYSGPHQSETEQSDSIRTALPPGRHLARLRTDGTGSAPSQILDTVEVGTTDLEVKLISSDGIEVRGTLVDSEGQPVVDALMRFVSRDAGAWTETRSGPDGSFTVHVLRGHYEIEVTRGPRLSRLPARLLPEAGPSILSLPAEIPLRVRLEDLPVYTYLPPTIGFAVDPLAIATVIRRPESGDHSLVGPSDQTMVIVAGPDTEAYRPPGARWLLAFPLTGFGTGKAVRLQDGQADVRVSLPAGSDTLVGTVRMPDGSVPWTAVIRLFDESSGVVAQTTVSAPASVYTLVVPSGRYRIRAALLVGIWDCWNTTMQASSMCVAAPGTTSSSRAW
jgi:M6 family metalloprotease-like protein